MSHADLSLILESSFLLAAALYNTCLHLYSFFASLPSISRLTCIYVFTDIYSTFDPAFRLVSCFVFRVSCFVFRVSCFVFRVSCFRFRSRRSTRALTPSFHSPAPPPRSLRFATNWRNLQRTPIACSSRWMRRTRCVCVYHSVCDSVCESVWDGSVRVESSADRLRAQTSGARLNLIDKLNCERCFVVKKTAAEISVLKTYFFLFLPFFYCLYMCLTFQRPRRISDVPRARDRSDGRQTHQCLSQRTARSTD
jgi:hypothetical protein